MTDLRQAAQQALDFVQRVTAWEGGSSAISGLPDRHGTLTALRTALAQQQAEPPPEWPLVKNILDEYGLDAISFVAEWKAAQRPWVGLTPEEVLDLFDLNNVYGSKWIEFARTVENKLKEKNA